MDLRWTWSWTVLSALCCGSLLRGSDAVTGLQIYYYRQPFSSSTNPIESWKVEGLATRILNDPFSDNLDCNTSSNNGIIGWTRQAGLNPNWVQSVANGKRLVLDGFNTTDLGIYTCYDNATNESVSVNITNANPAIQAVRGVVTAQAGSSAQLKVYVSGIPDPVSTDITWFKVGPGRINTELKEPTVNFSSDHRTLLLTNVQERDGGTYKCIVTQNFIGHPSANVNIQLNITTINGSLVPVVMFIQQPSNLSLVQSANATLSCSAIGSPAPNITWMRTGGSGLPSSAAIVTYGNSTTTSSILTIVNIQTQDGDQYQCQAIVPGTIPVLSHPAFIQVQQQATPQPTDTGTAPGTVASASTVLISTSCNPMQECAPSSPSLQTSTPFPVIVVGTAAGGGALLICVGAILLLYVCVYFRYCKPHKGVATWPENGKRTKSGTNVLFRVQDGDRVDNGEIIIQSRTPFKQSQSIADGEVLYDISNIPMPSRSNAVGNSPIYSPLTAPEEPRVCHEYSGIVGPSVPAADNSYSRLQRDSLKRNPSSNSTCESAANIQTPREVTSGAQRYVLSEDRNRNTVDAKGSGGGNAGDGSVTMGTSNSNTQPTVVQPPPPVQQLSQPAGKIPMRRHSSNTPAVVPEGPAALYSSAISALSSVPASSLSITSPSNVFIGPHLVERAPVINREGEKSGSSVLSSVPEHAVSVHRPYENVVIPAPMVKPPNVSAIAGASAVGPPPGYEESTTNHPWYELVEETDSDVNVPVHHGAVSTPQRVQSLQHHTSRSGQPRSASTHNSATHNVRPHHAIAYRGSLSREPPPRTEPKREAYFSASSLSCGTTV